MKSAKKILDNKPIYRYLQITRQDLEMRPNLYQILLANNVYPHPLSEVLLIPENHPDISFFVLTTENPRWCESYSHHTNIVETQHVIDANIMGHP